MPEETVMTENQRTSMVRVTGRVQGVAFRAWTCHEAQKLGLNGWVKNERDGSVVALISGPEGAVEQLLERLWQGPPAASVSAVEQLPVPDADIPAGFHITG
jgi:acylphosphatase